jgi:hypothetical protein
MPAEHGELVPVRPVPDMDGAVWGAGRHVASVTVECDGVSARRALEGLDGLAIGEPRDLNLTIFRDAH